MKIFNNNSAIFFIFFVILSNASTSIAFTKCNLTLNTKIGIISSSNETCIWRIVGSPDERIVLNITNLNIEKTIGCNSNYVEVRDGLWSNSPLLKKICGNDTFVPVTSTTNSMLITYVAETGKFTASFEAICGNDFYIFNETVLNSPNYPEKYPRNKKCVWKITTPETSQAALSFQSFDLENHTNCLHDYVAIRDGFTKESNLIGVYCGNTMPPQIISSTNLLLVTFVSDETVQGNGFSAILTHTNHNPCAGTNHVCAQKCINITNGYKCACEAGYVLDSNGRDCKINCGSIFNTTYGTITSPNFPGLYPLNQTCVYEIAGPPEERIMKLEFIYFNLEGETPKCNFDNLEIFNVFGTELKSYGVYCGSKRPETILAKSGIKIVFNSDSTRAKNGFVIDFKLDLDRCMVNNGNCRHGCLNTAESGECVCYGRKTILKNDGRDCHNGCKYEISSSSGVIKSPNYPDNYPHNANCEWLFTTTPGHRISVSFRNFSVETQKDCIYDNVIFYDGLSLRHKTLGKFCGGTLPSIVTSSSNELFMNFKSDHSNWYRGFNATYSSLCGGIYTASVTDHYIYSHQNFGVCAYNNNSHCEWTVKSSEGYHTRISFLTFQLESHSNCTNDYVEVFAGTNDSAPSVGRFCGKGIPVDLVGPEYYIRFRTDATVVYDGFSIRYRAISKIESY